jgi:glycosyltransferase involved in cell wall biosynthesis
MRILQVAMGAGADSGGPARSIMGLTSSLANVPGCEVAIFIHKPIDVKESNYHPAQVFLGDWTGNRFYSLRQFEQILEKFKPDIVHFHDLWNPSAHMDIVACRKRGIPYVIAPRGSLDAWSLRQKWFKKKLGLLLYQRKDLNRAIALHVTAQMEADHCRRMGYKGDFIFGANGVNLPSELPPRVNCVEGKRKMLFLSRIHPKKGLIELIRAWKDVDHNGWVLEIVGNDSENYWDVVKKEIESCGVNQSVIRTPFQDDVAKWRTYRSADCFVLPTHTENFGIVIAEAAYAGLPVLTTKNAPWSELVEENAGWWIDLNHHSLVEALSCAMSITDSQRQKMGENGRELIVKNYLWKNIAEKMKGEYARVLEKKYCS